MFQKREAICLIATATIVAISPALCAQSVPGAPTAGTTSQRLSAQQLENIVNVNNLQQERMNYANNAREDWQSQARSNQTQRQGQAAQNQTQRQDAISGTSSANQAQRQQAAANQQTPRQQSAAQTFYACLIDFLMTRLTTSPARAYQFASPPTLNDGSTST